MSCAVFGAVHLAGFDERSDQSPGSRSLIKACEQSDWANGPLDCVAIGFGGAVIEEPRQPVPTLERQP